MKELLNGIYILFFALLVSVIMFTVGNVYSFVYSIWLSITFKDWKAFLKFWVKTVDGMLSVVGHIFKEIAYALDLGWNVNGEILEDVFTHEENTTFGQKNITVSASIGKLQLEGKLNKFGKTFSKLLDVFFNEHNHSVDSWLYREDYKAFRSKYFKRRK
jgi:uncharacterized protein Usg